MLSKIAAYVKGHETVPGEAKLLRKLDAVILSFCCLCYFVNYLDRTNLNNAYVSGMREELNFQGNQLNQINTIFTVGYIVGQVPSNLALTFVSPRLFFPAVMVIWGGLTMITAAVSNPQGIMAIRFFLGLAESSTFVGTHYILGSWYTEKELGKRSGIFTASGLAGTMFGGFIQTGIHSSMDGMQGLSGWRWLFIIDGLITIPIAIYGFIVFPDTPTTTKARYLTAEEKALAVARIPESGTVKVPLNWAFLKSVFLQWYWWAFVVLWIIAGETESFSTNALLALYLQSHPTNSYTVSQLNNYPTGIPAVGIVSTLFWATLTDFMGGKRYLVGYFIAITGVVTSAMILTCFDSTATVMGAYYWAGAVYACQATFFAWCNDAMRYRDERLRSVVIASMNMGSNAVNAWWSILFYSADMAPKFTKGMWAMIAVSIALAFWTMGITFLTVREEKRQPDRDVRVMDLHLQEKHVSMEA
ncbi:major facilitator superfamily domain-containing protein [Aspergillus foveolatus]|uniref:major facilitator superfamily domain-containing protein n=1 Tax=Aspergillus foveolatus TaxID=210207 RepID=UPI003CCD8AC8